MAFSANQYVAPMGDGSFILYWNGKVYPFGNQQDAEQAYNEMERTGGASDGAVPRAGTATPPSGVGAPPSGGSGGGITTPPSGGGTVTPPSGGGSGGGFGVVGGTGQLDAQQWQTAEEYKRLALQQQKKEHDDRLALDREKLLADLEQQKQAGLIDEKKLVELTRQFDIKQASDDKRWQQDYDQRKIEFAQTYGLDVRRLDQQDSQFKQSQGQQNEQYWAGLLGSLSGPKDWVKYQIAQSQLPAGVQGGSLSDVFGATPAFGGMRPTESWEQVWANFQGPRPSLGAGAGGPAPYTPPGGGSGIPGDTMPVNPPGSLPPVRRDEQVPPLVRGGGLGGPGGGIPGDTMPVGGGGAQDWTDGGFWPNTPPFVGGGATTPPAIIPEQGPTGGRGIVPGFGPEPAPGSGQPPSESQTPQQLQMAQELARQRQNYNPQQQAPWLAMQGAGANPNSLSSQQATRTAQLERERQLRGNRPYDPTDQTQFTLQGMQGGQPQQQADWAAQRNANQGGREVFYSGQPQQNGKGPGTGYLGPPVRDDGAPRIGLGGGGPAPRDNSGGTGRPPIGLGGGGPAPRDKGAGTGYLGPPVRDDNGTGSNWTNTPPWQRSVTQPINYSRAEYNRMKPTTRAMQEGEWSAQGIDPSDAWNTMRQSWNSGGGGSTRTRWR